jgi:carbon storage regulator
VFLYSVGGNRCTKPETKHDKEVTVLILTRRVNETLVIDDKIEITVLQTRGNQVRIGIQAPREVLIHRKEVIQDKRPQDGESGNLES